MGLDSSPQEDVEAHPSSFSSGSHSLTLNLDQLDECPSVMLLLRMYSLRSLGVTWPAIDEVCQIMRFALRSGIQLGEIPASSEALMDQLEEFSSMSKASRTQRHQSILLDRSDGSSAAVELPLPTPSKALVMANEPATEPSLRAPPAKRGRGRPRLSDAERSARAAVTAQKRKLKRGSIRVDAAPN
jgi:hypothetical protein